MGPRPPKVVPGSRECRRLPALQTPGPARPGLTPCRPPAAAARRLHLVWGHLLALLLPGFKAVRVDDPEGAGAAGAAGGAKGGSGRAAHDTAQLAALWTYGVEQAMFSGARPPAFAAACLCRRLPLTRPSPAASSPHFLPSCPPGPSHERRYLALSLFQLLLPHLTTADVPAVFSRAFLQVRGLACLWAFACLWGRTCAPAESACAGSPASSASPH